MYKRCQTINDYYMLLHNNEGIEKLISPLSVSGKIKYYGTVEELFEILNITSN